MAILELEDFTPPEARQAARSAAPRLLQAWRKASTVPAARINPLGGAGRADLSAVMAGAPDIIMLPKVSGPDDIVLLDDAITEEERHLELEEGHTKIVPNIESAVALFQTREIAAASSRVVACLMASEDLTADLGAPRTKEGGEIAFARAHFHAACVAAGVLSIDYPYTFADEEGLRESCAGAKALGYRAKSVVSPEHAAVVNEALTPTAAEIVEAKRVVAAFERARAEGQDRALLDGHLIEIPSYRNAQALLARANALSAYKSDGS